MVLLHSISESLFIHQQKENNALNHKIDFFRKKNTLFMYYFTLKVFYFYSQIQTQIMVDFLSRPTLQTEHTKPNIRRSRLELQNKLISLYILLTKYFCLYPIVKNSVENYSFYLRLQTRITVTNCVLSLTIRTHATSDFSLTIQIIIYLIGFYS